MPSFQVEVQRPRRFVARASGSHRHPWTRGRWRSLGGVGCVVLGCSSEPTLVIGDWECTGHDPNEPSSASDYEIPEADVDVGWETSFENGFCDYTKLGGFCFDNTSAWFELVRSPVHSGRWAAAFHIGGQDVDGLQARCARQGRLPAAAYYGAWFYIPTAVTAADNWNLFHFEGQPPDGGEEQHGLWDVSLTVDAEGSLRVYVFDFLRGRAWPLQGAPAVPVGQWFHFEVYLQRSSGTTGRFTLYLNGDQLFDLADVATDDSDFGQWYVGNLATTLEPPTNTVFVDDVTISTVRQGAN